MAFSLIARCPRTNQIGVAICGAAIATGARALHCDGGIGAIAVQSRSDSRLGVRGLALLAAGLDAQATCDALVASTPHSQWRQLAVLDAAGNTAAFTGARTVPEMSEAPARDACAIGTALTSALAVPGMLRVLLADPSLPLAERLMRALEEGEEAGGNHAPSLSAMLRVMAAPSLPLVDLRIDCHAAPVHELRRLWSRYAPLAADIVLRATDPENQAIRQ